MGPSDVSVLTTKPNKSNLMFYEKKCCRSSIAVKQIHCVVLQQFEVLPDCQLKTSLLELVAKYIPAKSMKLSCGGVINFNMNLLTFQ